MLQIYNTQLHKKVPFESIKHGEISMYVCGPTVYNYIHIGNARTFISFDVIRRFLKWRGFKVKFVSNITDVDDKIIKRANEQGKTAAEVAAEYTKAFLDDMEAVNVEAPDVRPYATKEIPEMVELIQALIDGGHAYVADGDVYFAVRSFSGYGQLSGRNVDEMQAGHRELHGEDAKDRKRDELDFALWKAAKPGEPAWDSPWGSGRPGWHIECSAMAHKYLGLPFDIHGGGADLAFPHHENERAQAQAAYDTTFANVWMHTGMLRINDEKMSKSLGNFLLLRDVLKTTSPEVLRLLMLQTHYRSPLDFSQERLEAAGAAFERIKTAIRNIDWQMENAADVPSAIDARKLMKQAQKARVQFVLAMDDDFNAPRALGEVFDLVSSVNTETDGKQFAKSDVPYVRDVRETITTLMRVFGVEVAPQDWEAAKQNECPKEVLELAAEIANFEGGNTSEAVDALLNARAKARKAKNWAVADAVRDGLANLGFTIEDTPQGARVNFEGK